MSRSTASWWSGRGGPWLTPKNAPTRRAAAFPRTSQSIAALTAKASQTRRKLCARAGILAALSTSEARKPGIRTLIGRRLRLLTNRRPTNCPSTLPHAWFSQAQWSAPGRNQCSRTETEPNHAASVCGRGYGGPRRLSVGRSRLIGRGARAGRFHRREAPPRLRTEGRNQCLGYSPIPRRWPGMPDPFRPRKEESRVRSRMGESRGQESLQTRELGSFQ